jgi:hypothetical protein
LTKPQDAKAATRVVTCAYRAFLDTPFVSYKVSLSAGGDDQASDDEAPELDIDAEDAPPPSVVSIYDVRSRPKVTFSDAKKVLGGVVCVEPGVVVTSELMNMIDGVYKYMHSQKGTPFVAERVKGKCVDAKNVWNALLRMEQAHTRKCVSAQTYAFATCLFGAVDAYALDGDGDAWITRATAEYDEFALGAHENAVVQRPDIVAALVRVPEPVAQRSVSCATLRQLSLKNVAIPLLALEHKGVHNIDVLKERKLVVAGPQGVARYMDHDLIEALTRATHHREDSCALENAVCEQRAGEADKATAWRKMPMCGKTFRVAWVVARIVAGELRVRWGGTESPDGYTTHEVFAFLFRNAQPADKPPLAIPDVHVIPGGSTERAVAGLLAAAHAHWGAGETHVWWGYANAATAASADQVRRAFGDQGNVRCTADVVPLPRGLGTKEYERALNNGYCVDADGGLGVASDKGQGTFVQKAGAAKKRKVVPSSVAMLSGIPLHRSGALEDGALRNARLVWADTVAPSVFACEEALRLMGKLV